MQVLEDGVAGAEHQEGTARSGSSTHLAFYMQVTSTAASWRKGIVSDKKKLPRYIANA